MGDSDTNVPLEKHVGNRIETLEKMLREVYEAAVKHTDLRVDAEKERVDLRFTAAQAAIDTAKTGMDVRLEGMNRIRDQLTDQGRTFATSESLRHLGEVVELSREQRQKQIDALITRISALEQSQAHFIGAQAQAAQSQRNLVIVITIALTVLSLVFKFVV